MLVRKHGHTFPEAWGVTLVEVVSLGESARLERTGGVRLDKAWLENLKAKLGD